jgi:hypothetical protein
VATPVENEFFDNNKMKMFFHQGKLYAIPVEWLKEADEAGILS